MLKLVFFKAYLFILNSLSNAKYSNLLVVTAFSNIYLSSKTPLPVKNSDLPAFLNDQTEISAVCLSKSY